MTYLDSLRRQFNEFPLRNKQKRGLKKGLESFNNEDHLGAVNELAWWEFMRQAGLKVSPVPTGKGSRPDFEVKAPVKFFVEVSTLNVSDRDKSARKNGKGIPLNPTETKKTLERTLGKMTKAKQDQMSYASDKQQPCVLVIFDYTEWSGYGTQFFCRLKNFLFGEELGWQRLPRVLSALVYAERRVNNGCNEISLNRSSIYYNPNAKYPLEKGTFPQLNQFYCQTAPLERKPENSRVCL